MSVADLIKEGKAKVFSKLEIGEKFFERSSNVGMMKNYHPFSERVFEKVSKSKAKVVSMSGWGHNRDVNHLFSFGPFYLAILKKD